MENDKNSKNIHSGHRNRLREKVVKNGIESLADHEVLELILFYAIPRKNTNDIAHRLIKEFGSFSSVLEAPANELLKIDGISENSAFLIKAIPQISSYYMEDKYNKSATVINSTEAACEIFLPKYIGVNNELVMALFLDNSGKLLGCEKISEGIANAATINTRKTIELCIKHNATMVILCHNHPSGNPMPSFDDFTTTKNINTILKTMNCKVIDHVVIANDDYVSMKNMKQFSKAFE